MSSPPLHDAIAALLRASADLVTAAKVEPDDVEEDREEDEGGNEKHADEQTRYFVRIEPPPACPWCEAHTRSDIEINKRDRTIRYQVLCLECGASGPIASTEGEALRKWSPSAKPPTFEELIDPDTHVALALLRADAKGAPLLDHVRELLARKDAS